MKVNWLKIDNIEMLAGAVEEAYQKYIDETEANKLEIKPKKYAVKIKSFNCYLPRNEYPIAWNCPNLNCRGILARQNDHRGKCYSCKKEYTRDEIKNSFIWPTIKGMFR